MRKHLTSMVSTSRTGIYRINLDSHIIKTNHLEKSYSQSLKSMINLALTAALTIVIGHLTRPTLIRSGLALEQNTQYILS